MKKLNLLIIALVAMFIPNVWVHAATEMPEQQGNKITLEEDVTLEATYTVPAGVTEVDLGGRTITLSNSAFILFNSTTDAVITNGTIKQTGESSALVAVNTGKVTLRNLNVSNKDSDTNGFAAVQAGAESHTGYLIIEDGTIITGARGVSVFGNSPTLEIKGGKIETSSFAVSGNGDATRCNNSTITISGGELTSTKQAAIYQPQSGTLKITGGEISGVFGVVARQGKVDINGGKINAVKGEKEEDYVGDAKNGNDKVLFKTGTAIVVDNVANYGGGSDKAKVVVDGDVEVNSEVAAVYTRGADGESNTEKDIEVKSGTFSQDVAEEYLTTGVQQSQSGVVGKVHEIAYSDPDNGTVNVPENAAEGETVTVECTPDEGFVIDSIVVVTKTDGTEVEVVGDQFVMPEDDVIVTVTFKEAPQEVPSTGDNVMTYAVIGTVALVSVLGTALYFKKVNE